MPLSVCPTTSPWTRSFIGCTCSIRCAEDSRTSKPAAASPARNLRGKSSSGEAQPVIWTWRARADLRGIHAYISKDSRSRALRVVREIARKADALSLPPRVGRKVPEIDDPHLRQISAYSWRVIFHSHRAKIYVIAIIHKRRQPRAQDLAPARTSKR